MTELLEERYANVYLSIFALFCFKLFIKISLNIVTHFYDYRKEAARIAAEFYDFGQGHSSWADRSPLHEAASQGRLLALRTLLSQGYSANIITIDHVTPLHEACLGDHVACARVLLEHGASANVQKGRFLDTPLHAAAQKDCPEIIRVLLEFGANINSRNLELQKPVETAPPSSKAESMLLLYEATPAALSQLCRLSIREYLGRTRLHLIPQLRLPSLLHRFLQYR
uniref:Ankyrin repeat and SOCS box containing 5b n=1 Tax=Astyanax mexicanus TaxID=7994 RepID=A0A3B1KHL4_ASTMX